MEHDSPYQVMYKLGKGHHPPYPDDVEDEADVFLRSCFVFEPSDRANASALLDHPFVKVHVCNSSLSSSSCNYSSCCLHPPAGT